MISLNEEKVPNILIDNQTNIHKSLAMFDNIIIVEIIMEDVDRLYDNLPRDNFMI
jgi:hypothetical protein